MTETATLETRVRAAARRLRALRALEGAVWGAAGALAAIAVVGLSRALPSVHGALGAHATELAVTLWAVGLGVPALVACAAALRKIAALSLLTALDRSHSLSDLLSSAWAFSRAPVERRGRLSRITLARAEREARGVDIRRALPRRMPRGLFALLPAALVAGLAWFAWSPPPPAAARAAPAAHTPTRELVLTPAALAAFRQRLGRLDLPDSTSFAGAELRAAFERLLDRLAREPVDRREVLRRLGALEARARVLAAKTSAERAAAERAAAAWIAPGDALSSDAPSSEGGTNPPAASPPPSAAAPPAPPATEPPAPAMQASTPASDPGAHPGDSPASPPSGEHSAPPGATRAKPVAAAPSQPRNATARQGPELERERANSGAGRAERLADAIAELRDLMQRDETVTSDLGRPAPPPGADSQARDPERDGSRGDRPGAPDAAYARGGPQPAPRVPPETSEAREPPLPAAAVRLPGTHSAGPARSQVIYAAAQSGFAGGDYARVHAEYQAHAEREIERDRIPPGYRGYVRRYFRAIAPSPHK